MSQKLAGNTYARKRAYCFTWFNYDNETIEYLRNIQKVRYICWAQEICPTTGNPHLQGYVYFQTERAFNAVRKILQCNIRAADGTAEENKKYIRGPYNKGGKCKPFNETFEEIGDIPKQGKRNDLHVVTERIKRGDKISAIAIENADVYVKYHRGLEKLKNWVDLSKVEWNKVEIYETTAKRFKPENFARNQWCAILCGEKMWFDEYDDQEGIILIDNKNKIDYTFLINWSKLKRLETKGGFKYAWNLKRVVWVKYD